MRKILIFLFLIFLLSKNAFATSGCTQFFDQTLPQSGYDHGIVVDADPYPTDIYLTWFVYYNEFVYLQQGSEPGGVRNPANYEGGWKRCTISTQSDFDYCNETDNPGCLAYLETMAYCTEDNDSDGFTNCEEINCLSNLFLNTSTCNGTDTDLDTIPDELETLIGTNPNAVTNFVSGDYTNTSFANYDPTEWTGAVVIELTDGSKHIIDEFTLEGMTAFGNPDVYTLGDYGDIPEGANIKLYKVVYNDGVPTFSKARTITASGNNSDPNEIWTKPPPIQEYVGGSGSDGIGANVVTQKSNSANALDNWEEFLEALQGLNLSASTSATAQIDPVDIAQGVKLALDSVNQTELPSVIETEDQGVTSEMSSAEETMTGFGGTDFTEGQVITSGSTNAAIDSLSWVDNLYQIPEIGTLSSVTIEGYTFMGKEFPEMVVDFDLPIVSVIRIAFLFFYYLSCVWIFFKLTRYGWG